MSTKEQLLKEIQDNLNRYTNSDSVLSPSYLEFLDENTLQAILSSMKTTTQEILDEPTKEWLEKFKK